MKNPTYRNPLLIEIRPDDWQAIEETIRLAAEVRKNRDPEEGVRAIHEIQDRIGSRIFYEALNDRLGYHLRGSGGAEAYTSPVSVPPSPDPSAPPEEAPGGQWYQLRAGRPGDEVLGVRVTARSLGEARDRFLSEAGELLRWVAGEIGGPETWLGWDGTAEDLGALERLAASAILAKTVAESRGEGLRLRGLDGVEADARSLSDRVRSIVDDLLEEDGRIRDLPPPPSDAVLVKGSDLRLLHGLAARVRIVLDEAIDRGETFEEAGLAKLPTFLEALSESADAGVRQEYEKLRECDRMDRESKADLDRDNPYRQMDGIRERKPDPIERELAAEDALGLPEARDLVADRIREELGPGYSPNLARAVLSGVSISRLILLAGISRATFSAYRQRNPDAVGKLEALAHAPYGGLPLAVRFAVGKAEADALSVYRDGRLDPDPALLELAALACVGDEHIVEKGASETKRLLARAAKAYRRLDEPSVPRLRVAIANLRDELELEDFDDGETADEGEE